MYFERLNIIVNCNEKAKKNLQTNGPKARKHDITAMH